MPTTVRVRGAGRLHPCSLSLRRMVVSSGYARTPPCILSGQFRRAV